MNREQFLKDMAHLQNMTLDQAQRSYGRRGQSIRRALRSLRDQELITMSTELTRGRDVSNPIAVIGPGKPGPSAGEIAYQAETRWSDSFNPTVIIRATARLVISYGEGMRTVATGSISHEISLVEVILKKQQSDPQLAWTLVSAKPGAGAQPDAVSTCGGVLIELVGRYNSNRLSLKMGLATDKTLELW